MLLMILTIMVISRVSSPGYSSNQDVTQDQATQFIQRAVNVTDRAWEEFHAAAIEGTLASPLMQMTIEGQLHEVRALLMQARIAKRSQDYQSVKEITQRIKEITQKIIQESQERKP